MRRRLDLFGTIHFDRLSKVETELTDYMKAADADAVFVEWPTESASLRTTTEAAVRLPLVLLGGVVLELLRAPFYLLFNRRFDSTEHVAAERLSTGTPVHPVDRPLTSVMTESGPLAILLSWLVPLVFLAIAPIQTATTIGALGVIGGVLRAVTQRDRRLAAVVGTLAFVGGVVTLAWFDIYAAGVLLVLAALPVSVAAGVTVDVGRFLRAGSRLVLAAIVVWLALSTELLVGWFAFVAYMATGQFVHRTLDVRNERMLDRLTAIADEEGYETGVIATGLAHVSGLGERATNRDFRVSRTYTPRWLRAPGEIDEEPSFETEEDQDSVARDRPIQPGSTGRRTLASLVDLVVVAVLTWGLARGLDLVAPTFQTEAGLVTIGVVVIWFAYYTALEAAFGRTIGKRLTGLVVTDRDGATASTRAVLYRNIVRPVDFVVFYLVGFVTMGLTKRRQRLGDLLANTEVRYTK